MSTSELAKSIRDLFLSMLPNFINKISPSISMGIIQHNFKKDQSKIL